MLRKENELLIKESKLTILYSIRNSIVTLSKLETSEKTNELTKKLIDLYKKQLKNNFVFFDFDGFFKRVSNSIENLENEIEKIKLDIRSKEEVEIMNAFDIVASVVVSLPVPIMIDVKTLVVSEFLSYEKIAKNRNNHGKE